MTVNDTAVSDASPRTRIQSVSRAVRITLAVAQSEEGLSVKTIAERFDLSTPTAYHLLNTLADEGLIEKDERRRYILGPAAAEISEAFRRRNIIPTAFMRALNSLALETGETAYLSGWRDGAISVIATVEGSQAVRVAGLTTGYSDNLHARASAKVLLAFAPKDVTDNVLASMSLKKITANTITSKAKFRQELDHVRLTGIAHDRQEFREGVDCLSAPIMQQGDVAVACLTVSCPAERFARSEQELIASVRRAANDASTQT